MAKVNYLGKECILIPILTESELKHYFGKLMTPDSFQKVILDQLVGSSDLLKNFRESNEIFDNEKVTLEIRDRDLGKFFLHEIVYYYQFGSDSIPLCTVPYYLELRYNIDVAPAVIAVPDTNKRYLLAIPS